MAHANLGASAPSFQPFNFAGYPSDYYDLVRELSAIESKDELRRWALNTTARRSALPREAQSQLYRLTIHQQQLVRGATFGNAAPVIEARDADHLGTVVRKLLDVLNVHADVLTFAEARDFADAIRNTAAHHAPLTIEAEAA